MDNMDNQEYYDTNGNNYPDAPGPGTSVASVPEIQGITISQRSNHLVRKMEHRVESFAVRENAKARCTQQVIVNTTALSAIADAAIRAVPSAEAPVRHVVDAYASSAAQKITKLR